MAAGLEKVEELYCPTCEHTFARGDRCPADDTRLVRIAVARDAMIGRELDGRYTVVERLGAGGMGAVYRGTQHQLGREVAIKVVTPGLVKEPVIIKRFLREAKLASRLAHPNAVSVLDFGQTEDGLFFLVMELVAGRTLEELVLAEGKLVPMRVVRIGTQICDALEGAHALQIVHRDLKPQNVMVMATGRDLVKVLDFGLAKSLSPIEQGATTVTNAGALLGTPAFMPPELVLGEPCDARADLYALGCVLYFCAAGRVPFPSSSVHEVIAMHASEPPARVLGIPPRLWAVIEKLLEKDPAHRYQTAADARLALERALPAERPATDDDEAPAETTTLVRGGDDGIGSRARPRVATPVGIPKVSIIPASIPDDEAALIAGSATLPSDALASAAARASAAPVAASSLALHGGSPGSHGGAPAAARAARLGWKAFALVGAAALAAAALAFVLVDGRGPASSASPAAPASPSPPTSRPSTTDPLVTSAPANATDPTSPTPPPSHPSTTDPLVTSAPPKADPTSPTPSPPHPSTTDPLVTSAPANATDPTSPTPLSSHPSTTDPRVTSAPPKADPTSSAAPSPSPRPSTKIGKKPRRVVDKPSATGSATSRPEGVRRPVKTNPGVM